VTVPDTVSVKISSENAEAITMTPVVVQEMPFGELLQLVLGVTGKDAARIREILLRGSLVSGGSRFRWQGIELMSTEIEPLLVRYPDSDPSRSFNAGRCVRCVLRGGSRPLTIERTDGEKKRLFRGRSFWDELMELIGDPEYVEYSYRESADIYRFRLSPASQLELRKAANLIAYSSYEQYVRESTVTHIELLVSR